MPRLLQIKSSLFADHGVSSQLNEELLAQLQSREAGWLVTTRDFARENVPHVDGTWLKALNTPAAQRDKEQQAKNSHSDQLVSELMDADLVLLSAPMYNFTIPSMLKAWIDHVARAGVTFRYTDKGPIGLLTGKKVVVVATTGGHHERGQTDHVQPYLLTILRFLGLEDVEFILAGGLNMGAPARDNGLLDARRQIEQVVAKLTVSEPARSAA